MIIQPKSIAIIGNQGFSLLNFRGELIRDLVAHGYTVSAIAPDMDEAISAQICQLGAEPISVELARTGTNPFGDLASLLRLYQLLRRIRPEVVLSYAAKPSIYGTLAAAIARVPSRYTMIEGLGYVFIERENERASSRTLRRIVTGLFKLALARANKVFFLNPDDIADFTTRGLVRPSQAVNIGGIGVDMHFWKSETIVHSPVTFLFIGRLLRDKGILDFVAAARIVKARYPNVRFLVVGAPDDNPESIAQAEVENWVEQGLVEWPGHVPVKTWIDQSSVFVLPSYYREGVPRSTQEAMAMGRAVITTDAVGCRETVEDGRNGFLVPVRDPDSIAAAMMKFIADPELIVCMGEESRKIAEEKFDVRKINRSILEHMQLA